jgi:hypothetical protein
LELGKERESSKAPRSGLVQQFIRQLPSIPAFDQHHKPIDVKIQPIIPLL